MQCKGTLSLGLYNKKESKLLTERKQIWELSFCLYIVYYRIWILLKSHSPFGDFCVCPFGVRTVHKFHLQSAQCSVCEQQHYYINIHRLACLKWEHDLFLVVLFWPGCVCNGKQTDSLMAFHLTKSMRPTFSQLTTPGVLTNENDRWPILLLPLRWVVVETTPKARSQPRPCDTSGQMIPCSGCMEDVDYPVISLLDASSTVLAAITKNTSRLCQMCRGGGVV